MRRIEVRFTDRQIQALRRQSIATGESVAELVRRAVDQYLQERTERAIRAAGRFSSGLSDVSVMHDKYLAEAFRR